MSRWRTCVALYILAIPGGEVSAGCAEDIAASIMATANAPVVRISSTVRLPGVLYALARPSTTERWEQRGKVFKMKTTTRTGDEVSRETILIGTDYWARKGGQGWQKLDATVGKREHYFWRLVNSRDKKTGAETLRNVSCGDPFTEAGTGKRHLAHEIETFNGGFRHTATHHYIVTL